MICKECGKYFEEDVVVCDDCGTVQDIPKGKIKVLYHNNQMVYVKPPVITDIVSITENGTKKKPNKLRILIPTLVATSFILFLTFAGLLQNNPNKIEYRSKQTEFNSSFWTSGEFMLDGTYYSLGDSYRKMESNGWKYSSIEYPFLEDYTLDVDEKYPSYINLLNKKYEESNVKVEFINNSTTSKEINKCWINSLVIDNTSSKDQVIFAIPGSIKNGSTLKEIINAYGEVDKNYIKRDDINKYTIIEYNESHLHLEMTIQDDKGLQKVELYRY